MSFAVPVDADSLTHCVDVKQPSTSIDIESIVQAAWTEILLGEEETSDIGMDTPFYYVWGDLVAAAAIHKIYRGKGFEVSVEDIIDNPTIREQVKLLKENRLPISDEPIRCN